VLSNLVPSLHIPHLNSLNFHLGLHQQCSAIITLFRFITVLCGIDSTLPNILHIQTECEECFVEYCQSHRNDVMDMNNVVISIYATT
jgi:hypothetical protein